MFTYITPKFDPRSVVFSLINSSTDKVVKKYNIISAIVESYLIANNKLKDFELARAKQDLSAHNKFGIKINHIN